MRDLNSSQEMSRERCLAIIAEAYSNNTRDSQFKFFLWEVFVKELGYNAAAFLGYLINKYFYYLGQGKLASHKKYGAGWFYFTIDKAKEEIYLSRDEQDVCIKKLKSQGLIEQKLFSNPARRFFRLNLEKIAQILSISEKFAENPQTESPSSLRESRKLVCGKPTNRSLYNNTYSTNNREQNTHTPTPLTKPKDPEEKVRDSACAESVSVQKSPPTQISKTKTVLPTKDYGPDGLVKMTEKQYEDLLKHMSAEERARWIDDVSNEIGAQGEAKFNKKYSSHYHVILKWKRYREVKTGGKDQSKIAPHRRGSKYVTPGDYQDDDFEFPRM